MGLCSFKMFMPAHIPLSISASKIVTMVFLETEHKRTRSMERQKSISFICENIKAIATFRCILKTFALQINYTT